MPKVTITDKKGLVQSAGSGVTIDSGLTVNSFNSLIFATETLDTDAAAASTTIPVTILNHDGDEAVTLADGSTVGQIKIFFSSTANTVTLTPTSLAVSATIATTEIGSAYILMWTSDGWAVLSRSSNTNAAAAVVAGLPVLAG